MMLQRRLWLIVLAFSLIAVGSVSAQRMTFEPCLGLSDEDCALYYDFQDAGLPDSTSFDLVLTMALDGEMATNLTITATGGYVLDREAVENATQTFGELGILDVSPRDLLTLLDASVSAFDAELFIDLNGIQGIEMLTGGEALPTIDLWLVDGVTYADLTLVSTFLGDPSFAGVYGLDVFDITSTLLEDVTLDDLIPDDFTHRGRDDMGGMGMNFQDSFMQGFNQGFNQGFMMGAMMDESQLADFVGVERLADSTIDSTDVAVFQVRVDLPAIFQIPAFREEIGNSIEPQLQGEDFSVDELLDAVAEAMAGSVITVTESYDIEAGYLLSFDVAGAITLNPEALAQLDPEGFTGEEQPLNVDFSMTFNRSNLNQLDAIELPEGAQIVPLPALFGEMPSQS